MSLKEYRIRFLDGVVDLLWRQWSALGVSSHADADARVILDLDALVVFSSWAARYDERLYDLILSWLIVNGDAVNLQRLKALAKKSEYTDAASLRYIAGTVAHCGSRKWAALADASSRHDPEPLFLSADGADESFCPRYDELALRYGFVRIPFESRNLVIKPDATAPATTILRLRGLCGISARADVLAALIKGEPMTTAELAAFCGYTWKSINEALQELCASGLLLELRFSPRSCAYKLKDARQFADMLSAKDCADVNWFALFEAIGSVWQTISNPRMERVSAETIRAELNLLGNQITPNIVSAGLPPMAHEDDFINLPKTVVGKWFVAKR